MPLKSPWEAQIRGCVITIRFHPDFSMFDYVLISALETSVTRQYVKIVLLGLRAHQRGKAIGYNGQPMSSRVNLGSWIVLTPHFHESWHDALERNGPPVRQV